MSRALVSLALAVTVLAAVLVLRSDSRGDGPAAATTAPSPSATKPKTETAPKPPDRPSSSPAGKTAVQRALDEPAEFNFIDTPLKDVIDSIAARYKINVILESKSLTDAGVTGDTTITKSIKGVSLRSALCLTLRDKDLAFFEHADNVLLITTADVAKQQTTLRVYDLQNLFEPADADSTVAVPGTDLQDILDPMLAPSGSSSIVDGKLVVSQNEVVQSQVADLLAALAAARQQDEAMKTSSEAPANPVITAGSHDERIEKALDTRLDLSFTDTPLKDVVDWLHSQLGIEVQLDVKPLTDAGVTGDTTMSIKLKQVNARVGLRELLGPKDLNFIIDHDALLITTADVAKSKEVTMVYPVRDLVCDADGNADYDSLIEAITSTVSPSSWSGSGAGNIAVFPPCHALAFSQTEDVHRQVQDLLAMLRAAKKDMPRAATTPKNAMVLQVYSLPHVDLATPVDDKGSKQIVSVIRKITEPNTWNEPGSCIEVVPGAIVVRQTRDVHRQIRNLLGAMRNASFGGGFGASPAAPAKPDAKESGGLGSGGAF